MSWVFAIALPGAPLALPGTEPMGRIFFGQVTTFQWRVRLGVNQCKSSRNGIWCVHPFSIAMLNYRRVVSSSGRLDWEFKDLALCFKVERLTLRRLNRLLYNPQSQMVEISSWKLGVESQQFINTRKAHVNMMLGQTWVNIYFGTHQWLKLFWRSPIHQLLF